MPKVSKKRTASFKYCSKFRKSGCRKASKKCSYKKGRTPKCQPKKTKSSKKKSTKARKKSPSALVKAKSRPKSKKAQYCSRKKHGYTCVGAKDHECAWDPRKNKCSPKEVSIYDRYVTFKDKSMDISFTYPITKEGVYNCLFVAKKVGNVTYLFLSQKYRKALMDTMKPKYAKAMDKWFYMKGDKKIERYKADKDDNTKYRIGDGIKLTSFQVTQFTAVSGKTSDGKPKPCDELLDDTRDDAMVRYDYDSDSDSEGGRAESSVASSDKYSIKIM